MPIVATCPECGRRHSLADHLAGKTIKCKECGEPVEAPAGEEEHISRKRQRSEEVEERRKPARSQRDDDEDEDGGEPARGRSRGQKEKKGSGGLLLILGGVAALLLLGCGGVGVVGALFVFGGKSDKGDKPTASGGAGE
jgi:hypothetical protein